LILPHHGSVRPSLAEFVRAVAPEAAVRSSNERMADTLNGLQAVMGTTPVFNTADVGAVQVALDRNGVKVTPARSRP